jgi:hypothetical protein
MKSPMTKEKWELLVALDVTCKCGKPITQTNKYGMYCDDFCGMKEDIEAAKKLNKLFGGLFGDIIGDES